MSLTRIYKKILEKQMEPGTLHKRWVFAGLSLILLCFPLFAADQADELDRLLSIYGSEIEGLQTSQEQTIVLMKNGDAIVFDDGRNKTAEEFLAEADLEDQFRCAYPTGPLTGPPSVGSDPGRIRNESFFKAVYGGNAREVQKNLTKVKWMPASQNRTVLFNRKMGAADALFRVGEALDRLPAEFRVFLAQKPAGFHWRTIAGESRLSPHSFGIAVDIAISRSDYWRWSRPLARPLSYRNRIPYRIAEAFEAEGFIWGGKWYHYDTMHFEYRPECFR